MLKQIEVIFKYEKATKGTLVYKPEEEGSLFRTNAIYIDKEAFENLSDVPELIKITVCELQPGE